MDDMNLPAVLNVLALSDTTNLDKIKAARSSSLGIVCLARGATLVLLMTDHVTSTGHNIKWDNFDISATGRSDIHCKIKETLLIRDLKPALNGNVGSKKLFLY